MVDADSSTTTGASARPPQDAAPDSAASAGGPGQGSRAALAEWLRLPPDRLAAVPDDVVDALLDRLVDSGQLPPERAGWPADLARELAEGTGSDPVTGMMSKRSLTARLEEELDRCRRYGRTTAVVVLQVDRLAAGRGTHAQRLLETVAVRLRGALRTCDLLGLWSAAEVVAICPETDRVAADSLAARLHDALASTPVSLGAGEVRLAVRAGVALSSSHGSAHTLIAEAESELRQSVS